MLGTFWGMGSLRNHAFRDYWASEASPTLGCSIEISRDIYLCVCRMSNHVESRESNTRMLKVSGKIRPVTPVLFIEQL